MNGLPQPGKPGDLHLVPGHRPEHPLPDKHVIADGQLGAVHPRHLLGEGQNPGWQKTAKAVHIPLGDFKICLINGFHVDKTSQCVEIIRVFV